MLLLKIIRKCVKYLENSGFHITSAQKYHNDLGTTEPKLKLKSD